MQIGRSLHDHRRFTMLARTITLVMTGIRLRRLVMMIGCILVIRIMRATVACPFLVARDTVSVRESNATATCAENVADHYRKGCQRRDHVAAERDHLWPDAKPARNVGQL